MGTSTMRMRKAGRARRAAGMRPVNVWLDAELVARVDAEARRESRQRPGQMAVLLREALEARAAETEKSAEAAE